MGTNPDDNIIKHYNKGSKVLCFHGPLLYEAKILKIDHSAAVNGAATYLVHYKGWKTKWDEWVSYNRITDFTSEGLAKSRELKALHASQAIRDRKRRVSVDPILSDHSCEEEETRKETLPLVSKKSKKGNNVINMQQNKPEGEKNRLGSGNNASSRGNSVSLGARVRYALAKEWDSITKKQLIYDLPASTSINDALRRFKSLYSSEKFIDEFCEGLIHFFNKTVGRNLLYRFERNQFLHIFKEGHIPSEMYGSEHLCRIFLKISLLLTDTLVSEDSLEWSRKFNALLVKLIDYFEDNVEDLLRTPMIQASANYVALSKTQ